jgi:hypothetical protein
MPVLTLQNFLRGSSRQFLEMFPVTSQLSKTLIGGFGLCVIRQRCAANTKSEGNVGFENNDSFGELSCLSTLNSMELAQASLRRPSKNERRPPRPELAGHSSNSRNVQMPRAHVTCKDQARIFSSSE